MTLINRTRFLLLGFLLLVPALATAAEVKNVRLYQDGNKAVFTYDLIGDETRDKVKLTLTIGGQDYTQDQLHLDGDIGSVRPGKGKKIVWDVLQDFPRGVGGKMGWKLVGSGVRRRAEAGSRSSAGADFTDPVTGMQFIRVKGGCFQMGDTFGDGYDDEKPVHKICIEDYAIAKTEVTVGQFRKFVDDTGYQTEAEKGDGCYVYNGSKWNQERDKNWRDPGFRQNDNHPVACVSWNDAGAFSDWLSKSTRKRLRLPSEAEWEYAARSGGKKEKWSGTSSESDLSRYAWYAANSGRQTHEVGQKRPNGLGLYDMSGNVWEWVNDWYDSSYYNQSPRQNPQGPSTGSDRVLRGGSWISYPRALRSANRFGGGPGYRSDLLGFRLVLPSPWPSP